MVSKARLDLPDPDRPVTTTSSSRGISSEMFLRLWTRAPWTAIVVRTAAFLVFPLRFAGISLRRRSLRPPLLVNRRRLWMTRGRQVDERQLLDFDVALPGQPGRQRHL